MNAQLLSNSLLVAGATAVVSLIVGAIAAVAAMGLGPARRQALMVGAAAALALPPFVLTNTWLELVGLPVPRADGLPDWRGLGGAVFLMALMFWPVAFFLLLGGWQRLGREHLEVEPRLRGVALVRWWLIPAGRGSAAVALALVLVLGLNQFSVPALLQVKVLPVEMWIRFTSSLDTLGALAMAAPMIIAPILLLLALRKREASWPRQALALDPLLFRERFGRRTWGMSVAVVGGLLALSPGLPLTNLITRWSTWTELLPAIRAGAAALGNSLALAACTASCVVALALAAGRRRWAGLLWVAFLVPGVVLGVVTIFVFNRPPFTVFYQSLSVVVVVWGLRYFAPGWQAVSSALGAIDRNLLDAARLDGAGVWGRFRLVYWPQCGRSIAAAWYVVYLLCLWDTETLVLIMPPGGETASLRVFNFLHYGHNSQVNALCLALLGLALLPLLLACGSQWLASQVLNSTIRMSALGPRPSAVPTLTVVALAAAFTSGCSPGTSTEAPLNSRIFSAAQVIGSRGAGLGQFNKPRSVAVDAQDNLYVVDMTGRVQKFAPDGRFLSYWQMPQTDLGRPKGMCRDTQGHVVVLEPHYCRVNSFAPDGRLVEQWGRRGTNVGEMAFPRAVAVASDGRVYVSEYMYAERVQVFQPGGASCELAFGSAGSGPGQFNRAEGLTLDAAGRVYVADSCNHRIQVFENDGRFLRSYGKAGSGVGELSYPYDIAIDPEGRQYVCEFGNSRIQVFDAAGRSVEIIGGAGGAPGQFSNPWGVALDSHGNLYVADALNHRVQKLIRRSGVAPVSSGRGGGAWQGAAFARVRSEVAVRGTAEEMREPGRGWRRPAKAAADCRTPKPAGGSRGPGVARSALECGARAPLSGQETALGSWRGEAQAAPVRSINHPPSTIHPS